MVTYIKDQQCCIW